MAVVLLYHRIAETLSDPWALNVSPAHFAQHAGVLRADGWQPMSLPAVVESAARGALPDRAVAVTFDDGYADNVIDALPVLERYEVPATFFLPNCAIDGTREFWWDDLDRLLLQPGTLPAELTIDVDGQRLEWSLGSAAEYSADRCRSNRRWVAWEPPPSVRHGLYVELWQRCHVAAAPAREHVLAQLRAWAGTADGVRPTHRGLTGSEARALASSPLATIGAHTVSHPSLSTLARDEQRHEIAGSRAGLEACLGSTVEVFSYPFGKPSDYTADTMALVREAGYRSACCNSGGRLTAGGDPLQVPRMFVNDMDGGSFARWLGEIEGVSL